MAEPAFVPDSSRFFAQFENDSAGQVHAHWQETTKYPAGREI